MTKVELILNTDRSVITSFISYLYFIFRTNIFNLTKTEVRKK